MNLDVDLNADLGEGAGHDKELLKLVSSASIACGFHAGDAEMMHETISAARDQGVAVGAHPSLFDREVFADRNYLADGSLVPRNRPDALLHDPKESAARVMRMLREGKVQSFDNVDVDVRAETICVHGDTPGAVEFARVLRAHLEKEGVTIRAPKISERSERTKQ